MSLPCGCEPSLEGGYGDDGTHSRYSMEWWCPLHKAAPEMVALLRRLVKMRDDSVMEFHDMFPKIKDDARALLARLDDEV
mgnify:CR=1 FL=1